MKPVPTAGAAESPAGATADSTRLAAGALGLPSVIFCIVTGAAPLTAMMFNVPLTVLGSGYTAPLAFLIATVVLTVFSVGYIEMSGRVSSAGGFYTYITRGLGPAIGLGAGILIGLCYIVFAAAIVGVLGYFAATSVEAWFGVSLPGWVYTFVALAIISIFAWFHIELTAKVLGVALCLEVLTLMILAGGVLRSGGAEGLSLEPFDPRAFFANASAAGTFGAPAVGIALFGAFWSWVGFEMAPNYAEESRDPKRIAKAATYGAVVGLGVFYVFVSYVFVIGWGPRGAAPAIAAQFRGDFASAFYPLADRFVGRALTTMLEILVVTSSFACAMAFYNTGARYLYSLSREGILPRQLSRTHPTRQSPYVASMVVSGIVALYVLGFTIYDPGTEASLLKLGTWSPLLGVLGILAVQAIASFAIVRYFIVEAPDGRHWWKTRVAPLIGGIAQIGACVLLIANRSSLAGAKDVFFVDWMPGFVALTFAIGVAWALVLKSGAPARYASIGRFDMDDAIETPGPAPAGAGHVAVSPPAPPASEVRAEG